MDGQTYSWMYGWMPLDGHQDYLLGGLQGVNLKVQNMHKTHSILTSSYNAGGTVCRLCCICRAAWS